MNSLDANTVDQIVREVLRRLQSQPVADPAPETSAVDTASPTGVQLPRPVTQPVTPPSVLVLSQRLITAEVLPRRLAGVQTVRVPRRALVTPLVKDLLREKRIQLVFGGESAGTTPPILIPRVGLCLVGSDAKPHPTETSDRVVVIADCDDAVAQLGRSLRRLVVVTDRWAEVTQRIQRQSNLQVVSVESVAAAQQATQQLAVDVFVVNATNTSAATRQAIIQLACDT